jgi:protein-S-isoprenylcysteine O-methyltransferase Ste14
MGSDALVGQRRRCVLFLMGMGIVTWAESPNKFFEVTFRIQTERGHKVIDTGPYAIVRHPGYVGGILFSVGTALCLGSLWALLPAGLASALLILWTQWEDRTLHAELPGYKEYTQRVPEGVVLLHGRLVLLHGGEHRRRCRRPGPRPGLRLNGPS